MSVDRDFVAGTEQIILGGGCFWCVEAIMKRLRGVLSAVSGYAGGEDDSPTYQEVCSGQTGHAEVVKVTYDPSVIALHELLEVFFHTHDPTTPNRQGNDIGTQYRSVVFVADEAEREIVKEVIAKVEREGVWPDPIVTEIADTAPFYPAEGYHQDYFEQNGSQPYCMAVIDPKVRKFLKEFGEKVEG